MNSKTAIALLVFGCAASPARSEMSFQSQMLLAHNQERQTVRIAPLIWDAHLAADADAYASELARTSKFGHSSPDRRLEQGENLWAGTHAAYSPADMVAAWTSERRVFRSGVFPDVSRSGSWHDVGHYTQIVWPATTRMGCGLRSSAQWDFLVCRYSSPGNVFGDRIGSAKLAAR